MIVVSSWTTVHRRPQCFVRVFLVSGGSGWGGVGILTFMYKFIHDRPARHRTSSYLIRQGYVGGVAELGKVAPQKVASCWKIEWPSLCQQRSEQNVTSMDLAPKCVALFPKELDVRITKALEATCWLKAFFAKKLIVWSHSKTRKIIHFSNGIKEWRRFSQWHGSVEENETLLTWNTVELRRKKARHADVPFALGAAVSRGPS